MGYVKNPGPRNFEVLGLGHVFSYPSKKTNLRQEMIFGGAAKKATWARSLKQTKLHPHSTTLFVAQVTQTKKIASREENLVYATLVKCDNKNSSEDWPRMEKHPLDFPNRNTTIRVQILYWGPFGQL